MIPFNLKEYLANPNKKLVTRDGRKVTRVLCTNAKGPYPIVALVESYDGTADNSLQYTKRGQYFIDGTSNSDLFFAPEKHEGWINVYLDAENDSYVGTHIYKSKEDAENNGKIWGGYVTTLKIEWGN